jgi:release factor glutamine methyltransferase
VKNILVFIADKLYKPWVKHYVSRPTRYRYGGTQIVVLPGVFHPRFFFSTKLLLKLLKTENLQDKFLLELGAGSGLISVIAAKGGAVVTATDISSLAIENVIQNQQLNRLQFKVIQSDLFEKIPACTFDVIVINPPYYKKNPVSEPDHAWYCGENGEYFVKLFSSLGNFMHPSTNVLMVLSDVCDIAQIKTIALQNSFELELLSTHRLILEENYIFRIKTGKYLSPPNHL